MVGSAWLYKFVSRLAMTAGAALCFLAVILAIYESSAGPVVIKAEALGNLIVAQDAPETHPVKIVNETGRRIWLHNAQGWG